MKIREIVKVNVDDKGVHILQSMPDDRILLQLLIERRKSEKDEVLKEKIRNFIKELYG